MLNRGLFITGTDTNVGKTIVSALLADILKSVEPRLRYFKPVQTGSETDSDTNTVVSFAQLTTEQFYPPIYTFKAPLSPDRAGALENQVVDVDKLVNACREARNDFLIVEGAGGLEVPLNEKTKFSSLMKEVNLPVVLVASTRLGTINHTLLSVERIKTLGISFLGLVLVGEEDKGLSEVFEREGVNILFKVPKCEDLLSSWSGLKAQLTSRVLPLANATKEIEIKKLDQELIWHPYTQHGTSGDLPEVRAAQGSEIFFADGNKVIDGISSWWVNLHGHSHPVIAQAIAAQAHTLEHVIFAGYTHKPAVQLADKLIKEVQKLAPQIEKVFYSDNGSTAVEVALKMAYQAQKQNGEQRRERFLALEGSYHGDTLAAMSASDRNGFHKIFTPLMAPVDFIEPDNFEQLESIAFENYAAVIFEPLVQGAGGMKMYSPAYLKKLSDLCRAKGVYLIADEVFTGFYRTGTFLACEQAQVQPDLICLSKGITGGFLPLSVTLTTKEVFAAFESPSLEKAFLHGHSYTANPIACAAANASFDILMSDETQEQIRAISQQTRAHLDILKTNSALTDIRSLGTIGAFNIKSNEGYFKGSFSKQFAQETQKAGVLLRPLGGVVYTLPPYCTSTEQMNKIYKVIESSLKNMEIL